MPWGWRGSGSTVAPEVSQIPAPAPSWPDRVGTESPFFIYTASGSFALELIPSWATNVHMAVRGGGGGGGTYQSYAYPCTGGGGGGFAYDYRSVASLTHSLVITVGAGGALGNPDGANGGTSSISHNGTDVVNATGGTGGYGSSSPSGGGNGVTGSILIGGGSSANYVGGGSPDGDSGIFGGCGGGGNGPSFGGVPSFKNLQYITSYNVSPWTDAQFFELMRYAAYFANSVGGNSGSYGEAFMGGGGGAAAGGAGGDGGEGVAWIWFS